MSLETASATRTADATTDRRPLPTRMFLVLVAIVRARTAGLG